MLKQVNINVIFSWSTDQAQLVIRCTKPEHPLTFHKC